MLSPTFVSHVKQVTLSIVWSFSSNTYTVAFHYSLIYLTTGKKMMIMISLTSSLILILVTIFFVAFHNIAAACQTLAL